MMSLKARLEAIALIIETVDRRVLAVDGAIDIGDFGSEIRQAEARAIYVLAKGEPAAELARALKILERPPAGVAPYRGRSKKTTAARVAGRGRPSRKKKR